MATDQAPKEDLLANLLNAVQGASPEQKRAIAAELGVNSKIKKRQGLAQPDPRAYMAAYGEVTHAENFVPAPSYATKLRGREAELIAEKKWLEGQQLTQNQLERAEQNAEQLAASSMV